MALTISRLGQARLRPQSASAGRRGDRIAHSASIRSLPWRSPARLCCRRAVGVHIEVSLSVTTLPTGTSTLSPVAPSIEQRGQALLDLVRHVERQGLDGGGGVDPG